MTPDTRGRFDVVPEDPRPLYCDLTWILTVDQWDRLRANCDVQAALARRLLPVSELERSE